MMTAPSSPNGNGSMILSTAPTSELRSEVVTSCDCAMTSASVTESFSAFWVDQILKVTSRQPIISVISMGSRRANSIAATPRLFRRSL
jgi:hypothetical protein